MAGWINPTEKRLTGGHPNSLGDTVAVAEEALSDTTQAAFNDLCACYASDDEVVRLRVSSALKRVAGCHRDSIDASLTPRPDWLVDRFDWLVDDIGRNLDQPSAKWSIAQILMQIDELLSDDQRSRGVALMKHNLDTENDWIATNFTAEMLTKHALASNDHELAAWLAPRLHRMAEDPRKSVAGKGRKFLALLGIT